MQTKKTEIRRFSPLLESSGNGGVALDEWKAVPDIWRTSAEKYGDKVALVDQYHDPPSTMTYKQVFFLTRLIAWKTALSLILLLLGMVRVEFGSK
jgi:hypothetical protein